MILAKKLGASILISFTGMGLLVTGGCSSSDESGEGGSPIKILNVSYDPTRELYKEYNENFAAHWKATTGQAVAVDQSHGGSGKQAGAVNQGLEAAVVTLALSHDIDTIQKKGLIKEGWRERLPHRSSPYTSTIVFLVRGGNPKGIKDWDDLVREDVSIITPHPKTSGGAKWNYLAAWGYALKRELGDLKKLHDPKHADAVAKAQEKARDFVAQVFRRVAVLDSGARQATTTFVKNGQGDVLLAWENEALLSFREQGSDKLKIVTPSISILAEPSVAVVDAIVDRYGTREVAEGYLKHLYSPEGQALVAKHFYRPSDPKDVPEQYLKQFQEIELFTVDDVFGSWQEVQVTHFDDRALFDQAYQPGKK